jgi:hypothetical protein
MNNSLLRKAVVELDELSTSTSHQQQQQYDPTSNYEKERFALPSETQQARPATLELGGELNPAFVDECNDTPC